MKAPCGYSRTSPSRGVSHLLGPDRTAPAVWLGVATALILMAAFQLFQRWRYSLSAGTLTALQKLETPRPEGPPRAGDGSTSGG